MVSAGVLATMIIEGNRLALKRNQIGFNLVVIPGRLKGGKKMKMKMKMKPQAGSRKRGELLAVGPSIKARPKEKEKGRGRLTRSEAVGLGPGPERAKATRLVAFLPKQGANENDLGGERFTQRQRQRLPPRLSNCTMGMGSRMTTMEMLSWMMMTMMTMTMKTTKMKRTIRGQGQAPDQVIVPILPGEAAEGGNLRVRPRRKASQRLAAGLLRPRRGGRAAPRAVESAGPAQHPRLVASLVAEAGHGVRHCPP